MIYLIKSAGYDKNGNFIDLLKIGYTKDINCDTRIMSYIYHNPTCKLLFTIPLATEEDESNLQYYFREHLFTSGVYSSYEWFYSNDDILEYFKTHTTKESLVDLPNSPSVNYKRSEIIKFRSEVKNIIKYVINIRFLENEIDIDDSIRQIDNMVSHVIDTLQLRSISKVWEYVGNTFGIFPVEFSDIKDIDLKKEVSNFMAKFNEYSTYPKRMEILCESNLSENAISIVLKQIPLELTTHYKLLGPEKIKSLRYKKYLIDDYILRSKSSQYSGEELKNRILTNFKVGNKYLKSNIKNIIADIYTSLGIKDSPKAVVLEKYFELKLVNLIDPNSGNRIKGFEIIKIKDI